MTREQARREIDSLDFYLQNHTDDYGEESHTAMMMAKDALSNSENPNTCDDAISRAIVQEEITKSIELKENPYQLWYRIRALPSVSPQQRTGRWEWVQYDVGCGNWHCSECRTIIPHMPEETDNTPIYKWCPMCGAKMEV